MADSAEQFRGFFMNRNEEFVCALGVPYLKKFLKGGDLTKGFSVVSDKKVYFRGATYHFQGGKLKKTKEAKELELEYITSANVTRYVDREALTFGIVTMILGILFWVYAFIYYIVIDYPGLSYMNILAEILLSVGLIALLKCWLSRKNIFKIEFVGGDISLDVREFSDDEIENYRRGLVGE